MSLPPWIYSLHLEESVVHPLPFTRAPCDLIHWQRERHVIPPTQCLDSSSRISWCFSVVPLISTYMKFFKAVNEVLIFLTFSTNVPLSGTSDKPINHCCFSLPALLCCCPSAMELELPFNIRTLLTLEILFYDICFDLKCLRSFCPTVKIYGLPPDR